MINNGGYHEIKVDMHRNKSGMRRIKGGMRRIRGGRSVIKPHTASSARRRILSAIESHS